MRHTHIAKARDASSAFLFDGSDVEGVSDSSDDEDFDDAASSSGASGSAKATGGTKVGQIADDKGVGVDIFGAGAGAGAAAGDAHALDLMSALDGGSANGSKGEGAGSPHGALPVKLRGSQVRCSCVVGL